MDFSQLQLDSLIQKALTACNYSTPTPIQEKAIPVVLDKKDVAASAETGSGKTAAFVLPTLHHLHTAGPAKHSRVLILTPTRELAAQIAKATDQYGKFLKPKIKVVCLVGGLPYHHQIRDLSRGADIIVATPGRLLDYVRSKRVDLSQIDMLVLDEADRMLDMGFIEDIETVVDLTPASRQTLLFSATLDKNINNIVKRLMNNPVHIDLSKQILTGENITQLIYKAQNSHHKSTMLRQFLNDENIFKAIIFSATKVNAERLAQDLCDDGFQAASLHGDLRQRVRDRTVDQLRSGKIQYLVATDVAARGIDISDITHVFNYDLPRDGEDYVHRIGRTGRAGKQGTAISFVTSADFRILQRIERYIGKRLSFEGGQSFDAPKSSSGSKRRYDDKPRGSNDRKPFERRESREGRHDDRSDRFVKRQASSRSTSSFRDKDDFKTSEKSRYPSRDRATDERSNRFEKRKSNERSFEGSEKRASFSKERSFDGGNSRFDKRKRSERSPFRDERSSTGSERDSKFSRARSTDERRSRFEKSRDRNNERSNFSAAPKERFSDSSKRSSPFEKNDRSAKKSFANKSNPRTQGRSERFSDERPERADRTERPARRATGERSKKPSGISSAGHFQRVGAPKTTTWRKKESA